MKGRIKTVSMVTLQLSEKEAKWLKGYVQNPLMEDESAQDSQMRQELFNALTHPEKE